MSAATVSKPMITDVFVKGARQGWEMATKSMLPNVIMAFILIKALNVTGLLGMIGQAFSPLMGLFGLPGEAATILMSGYLSSMGGIGVAIALFEQGVMNGEQLAVILPSIFVMGGQLQYMGRCLGVIGIKGNMMVAIMCVPIVMALVVMMFMRLVVVGV